MRQKFPMFALVYVCKEMPDHMKHFKSDFVGIVGGTYSQLYGGKDVTNYHMYTLRNGKVHGAISWYKEDQLTLVPCQNRSWCEQAVENYNFRDS